MPLLHFAAPFCRELARALPERPFAVEFWDGSKLPATQDGGPTFYVKRPSAIAHALRAPGPFGLGRAYVEGSLDCDDVDKAFILIDDWEAPELSSATKARLLATLSLAAVPGGIPRRPRSELILRGERHSPERDAAAVRYHYDVGNEFFALFLDESMTYSCAVFSKGATTLAEAQRAKLDLVCHKLELEPGMRVLDVGCGWGSFAIHAATNYGVNVTGITLSPAQAELARKRVAEAGLAERIEIRIADYRALADEPFDAISSIGMAEHVGIEQIDTYAKALYRVLKPGRLVLNHAISLLRPEEDPSADKFTMRYVFPDGHPLLLSRTQQAFEDARFRTEHVEGFMKDYADTLRAWHDNLDQHLEEAERLAGPERLRVWRLYLRAARHGFDVGYTAVYQLKARRPA
jgi:cyclopropane-fatty-acyl-phospholipid synthase